jgi:Concanavalin A-like lectin/glucanases superfamily/F5/8 type C domain
VAGRATTRRQDGSRTAAFTLGYSGPDNRWLFSIAGSDVDVPTVYKALSDVAPVAGRWTQLIGVYDATTKQARLYVNGVLQVVRPTVGGAFNAAGKLAIGRRMWAGNPATGFFNGDVDEVRAFVGVVVDRSGPNLALTGTAHASSNAAQAWGWWETYVNNGLQGTDPSMARMPGWSSWQWDRPMDQWIRKTEWIEIDLPSAQQVSRVDLYARQDLSYIGDNFPANFTIEVMTPTGWVPVVTKTGYPEPVTGEVQSFTFAPKTTDKIRVVGTDLYMMQLAEMEIYGGVNAIP